MRWTSAASAVLQVYTEGWMTKLFSSSVACAKYRNPLRVTIKSADVQQGLTSEQRFFLAYAQSWRTKTREPALRQQIVTDGHAPGRWRALTVRNLDGWYEAFGVTPGADPAFTAWIAAIEFNDRPAPSCTAQWK